MNLNLKTAPSFITSTRNTTNASRRAFIIEALVLLVFLAASVAIILQLFVAAGNMSREAHLLSMSEHLAVNAAEVFGANPEDSAGTVYYTNTGELLPGRATATFAVETSVFPRATETGTLYEAQIKVTSFRNQSSSDVTYTLTTMRYLSNNQYEQIGGAQ